MENKKPTLLILVDWFTPGFLGGGPIQSCKNVAFFLKDRMDVQVLTTDTDFNAAAPYPDITANQWIRNLDPGFTVYYAAKTGINRKQVKAVLQQCGADILYLNQLFSPLLVIYPLWLKLTGAIQGTVVLCPRGALYESALDVKRWKKAPFLFALRFLGIQKKIRFHATNEREKAAILKYFPGAVVRIADNLPNTQQPGWTSIPKDPGSLRCIFIARVHPIKNLLYLIERIIEADRNIHLTIIGPFEDKAYWEKCRQLIDSAPQGCTFEVLGPVPNQELSAYLQAHHLYVLPTQGENFGHSIFEAFLNGRPVLISDQTPWKNLKDNRSGWELPLDATQDFTTALQQAVDWNQADFDSWTKAAWNKAHEFIRNPELEKQYTELFHDA